MKIQFLKLNEVKHSGQVENATHKKVMREFEKSYKDGLYYCEARGWQVYKTDTVLRISSPLPFGFYMSALIKEI